MLDVQRSKTGARGEVKVPSNYLRIGEEAALLRSVKFKVCKN
jgi:hypothetical protein